MADPQNLDAMLNSSAREQRIEARRQRIAARIAAKREGDGEGKNAAEAEEEELGQGKLQIADSRKRLKKLLSSGRDQVTSVRVMADDRENRRRIEEESRRQELRGRLLAEAEHSARRNATVAMRWADLFSLEVPQELYAEIEKQREACNKITASKDRLINEIKNELKAKDDEYVKALKKQAEDVDVLLGHMGKVTREFQAACLEELEEIEQAFLQGRQELLDANKLEMEALFEKRHTMEQNFMDASQQRAETFHADLEALRVEDAEQYNILKIRLETDIQNLEQHLEAMRATYQLNTEKLEYNYRVLTERNLENTHTINQQRRKIARQRDILSSYKSKYMETDKRFQVENMKLTDEYKRITEQFKDLQAKYRHFEQADIARYSEVRAMNEEIVAGLVKKVLEADKIIHQQQLGLKWHAPLDVFDSATAKDAPTRDESDDALAALTAKLTSPQFMKLAELICDEAGFLMTQKVKAMLQESSLTPEQRAGLTIEACLKHLGVTDATTLDVLAAHLSADGPAATATADSAADDAADGSVDAGAGPDADAAAAAAAIELVKPEEVVQRLKTFVEAEQQAHAGAGKPSVVARATAASAESKEEKEFWARMSNVINEKMFRIWKALEQGLLKYHKLLSSRLGSLDETHALQKQNDELRALLNQYLSSQINKELLVPPTQVI
mmetsp:Transcript_22481/g.73000  ORF Transcript_22481/g.73000 Transcript_22481/m.73000 type:complete len:675 (+) Transcript_22481:78-2102(+)|eukprot:CAMPEP_0170135446 /NCGR_PEP_ID=MMETSP0033_2-20121228/2482_1 /TAXON_ID=195969 /ORGANISM="Dolichomastix tenuilepis, Strain CCMP3274" /LENGTH=674 /DNA_ID=CAMNT_0010371045 /DNA_START=78 /DNA_END=2102 /DNA_ORIENTATION=+